MSAPQYPSVAFANSFTSISSVSFPLFSKWISNILSLSSSLGKSMKNTSSNLPFLKNSGGKAVISLAVATTKTVFSFSYSQVKNCPNNLFVISLAPPS